MLPNESVVKEKIGVDHGEQLRGMNEFLNNVIIDDFQVIGVEPARL